MQIMFYPCISPWSRGSRQKFFVRMQDVFWISPYTGHYSFHFELKIHMASLIKSMQGWGQVIYKYLAIFIKSSPISYLTTPLSCLWFLWFCFFSVFSLKYRGDFVVSALGIPYSTGGGGGGCGLGYSSIWPIRGCAAAAGQGMFFTSLS